MSGGIDARLPPEGFGTNAITAAARRERLDPRPLFVPKNFAFQHRLPKATLNRSQVYGLQGVYWRAQGGG